MTSTILLVGDSHMEALGRMLPPMLARHGLRTVHAEANRGKSTAWYVQDGRLGQLVDQYRPDIVLVELSGNDRPNPNYAQTLRTAVEQIRQAGNPKIVWFGPPYSSDAEYETRRQEIRDRQEGLLPQLGVSWHDSSPMTRRGHAPDRIHFTAAGYRAWATSIANEMAVAPSPTTQGFPIWFALLAAVGATFFFRSLRGGSS